MTEDKQGIFDSINLLAWTARELPIRFLGNEVLRSPCAPVGPLEFGSVSLKNIHEELVDSLSKYREHIGMGRGMAANQIGHNKQVIVVWFDDKPVIMYNPKLISSSGTGSYWESCISSGTLLIGEVKRPWSGEFEYQTEDGQVKTLEADEKQTRVLLHEIDHLDGIMCSDKYEPGTLKFVTGGKEEIMSYKLTRID